MCLSDLFSRQIPIKSAQVASNEIVVTFTLNEAGTVYCRPTRRDSGETNLQISTIVSADWSATFTDGGSDTTITMTSVENTAPPPPATSRYQRSATEGREKSARGTV